MQHKSQETIDRIIVYVEDYFKSNGYSPTITQIGKALGIARCTVHRYIDYMKENGILRYSNNEISTDVTMKVKSDVSFAGISGTIPCGTPEEQAEQVETYIPLPSSLVGRGDFFILKAKGESMIDAGIDSGDLVVVRKQKTAKEGEIIAALVDGSESTLKTLTFDEDRNVVLHPENATMKDIRPMTGFEIQGVAVYVLKKIGAINQN